MSSLFRRAAALFAAIVLTAPLCAQPKPIQKSYAVADLVVPVRDFEAPGQPQTQAAPIATRHDTLMELIKSSVSPNSWTGKGGAGNIAYCPLTMSIIVEQSPDRQEQVADLLEALRKSQETEVVLEVRLISVAENGFERIGVDFERKTGEQELVVLNDTTVAQFMEAIQGDRRTNVLQAPRMTLFNGQTASVEMTDKQYFVTAVEETERNGQIYHIPRNDPATTGLRMTAKPVVSADGTCVHLDFKMDWTQLASEHIPLMPVTTTIKGSDNTTIPFTQFIQQPRFTTIAFARSANIPDGNTVLLGRFQQKCEGRQEYGPPVLSKIPYVNRLFKNVGYGCETKTVLVLVSARIINTDETQAADEKKLLRGDPRMERSPGVLGVLLEEYEKACAQGQDTEAAKLARAALAIDPKCFGKK